MESRANPQQNVTTVKAEHIRQLRTKLAEALNALHLPVGGYEHPTLTENERPIYAVDFQELRTKIKDAWTALASTSSLTQAYDGDGLRVKKTEYGWSTFYVRSSVLGGQVISEIGVSASGGTAEWQRGYVYAGSSLMAVQQQGGVFWTYEDPVSKSKRVTDSGGNIVSTIDLDPWGGETNRSSNQAFQPQRYTSYTRDSNGGDDAMFRRYQSNWTRFTQPDPYDGSYDITDPQSFNRYAYVQNDPVNFTDPSGLDAVGPRLPGPPPPPQPPRFLNPTQPTFYVNSLPPSGTGFLFGGNVMFVPVEMFPDGIGGGDVGGGGLELNPPESVPESGRPKACEGVLPPQLDYGTTQRYKDGKTRRGKISETSEQHIRRRHLDPTSGASQYFGGFRSVQAVKTQGKTGKQGQACNSAILMFVAMPIALTLKLFPANDQAHSM